MQCIGSGIDRLLPATARAAKTTGGGWERHNLLLMIVVAGLASSLLLRLLLGLMIAGHDCQPHGGQSQKNHFVGIQFRNLVEDLVQNIRDVSLLR